MTDLPKVLNADLPLGEDDQARHWCAICGLPDPPQRDDLFDPMPPCPRCGSTWQWYGRIADRDGTATAPPEPGEPECCYEWRKYPPGQEHFGWTWWRTCGGCDHEHHASETWIG